MKKLGLLLIACFAFAAISVAQNNIVKSLERNVPGLGSSVCKEIPSSFLRFKSAAKVVKGERRAKRKT